MVSPWCQVKRDTQKRKLTSFYFVPSGSAASTRELCSCSSRFPVSAITKQPPSWLPTHLPPVPVCVVCSHSAFCAQGLTFTLEHLQTLLLVARCSLSSLPCHSLSSLGFPASCRSQKSHVPHVSHVPDPFSFISLITIGHLEPKSV